MKLLGLYGRNILQLLGYGIDVYFYRGSFMTHMDDEVLVIFVLRFTYLS